MKKSKLAEKLIKKKTPMSDYVNRKYGDLSRFESGIYNYCDRWCERCDKQDKCFLYYKEQIDQKGKIVEGKDPDSWETVLETVKESFEETKKMIEMIVEEEGLDLDLDNLPEEEGEDFWQQAAEMPLAKKARHFLIKAHQYVEKIEEDLERYPFLADKLDEDLRVFCHYYPLLETKIQRALASKLEYEKEKGDLKKYLKEDIKKTSQLISKCLEKCRQSLKNLLSFREEDFDQITELLILLTKFDA